MKARVFSVYFVVLSSLVFASVSFAQHANTDLQVLGKALKLLQQGWVFQGLNVQAGRQAFLMNGSNTTDWLELYLLNYPIDYSLDEALIFQKYMVFSGVNRETGAKYFLIALFDSHTILAVEPDMVDNKLVLLNL
jgi:hypothetical protein